MPRVLTPVLPPQAIGSGAPESGEGDGRMLALRYAGAAVAGALALLAIYLLARRSGTGSR